MTCVRFVVGTICLLSMVQPASARLTRCQVQTWYSQICQEEFDIVEIQKGTMITLDGNLVTYMRKNDDESLSIHRSPISMVVFIHDPKARYVAQVDVNRHNGSVVERRHIEIHVPKGSIAYRGSSSGCQGTTRNGASDALVGAAAVGFIGAAGMSLGH